MKKILSKVLGLFIDLIGLIIILVAEVVSFWWLLMNTYMSLIVDQNMGVYILCLITVFLYFFLQEYNFSTTIGKRIMNLYIQDIYNNDCNKKQIILRFIFNILLFPINIFYILCTKGEYSLSDKILKIRVGYLKDLKILNTKKVLNKNIISPILLVVISFFIVLAIIPKSLYVEQLYDENRNGTFLDGDGQIIEKYLFTRSREMDEEEILELIIKYDESKYFEPATGTQFRYYFPTQYKVPTLMGAVKNVVQSEEEKKKLIYYGSVSEADGSLPIPVVVIYDFYENDKLYMYNFNSIKLPMK